MSAATAADAMPCLGPCQRRPAGAAQLGGSGAAAKPPAVGHARNKPQQQQQQQQQAKLQGFPPLTTRWPAPAAVQAGLHSLQQLQQGGNQAPTGSTGVSGEAATAVAKQLCPALTALLALEPLTFKSYLDQRPVTGHVQHRAPASVPALPSGSLSSQQLLDTQGLLDVCSVVHMDSLRYALTGHAEKAPGRNNGPIGIGLRGWFKEGLAELRDDMEKEVKVLPKLSKSQSIRAAVLDRVYLGAVLALAYSMLLPGAPSKQHVVLPDWVFDV